MQPLNLKKAKSVDNIREITMWSLKKVLKKERQMAKKRDALYEGYAGRENNINQTINCTVM